MLDYFMELSLFGKFIFLVIAAIILGVIVAFHNELKIIRVGNAFEEKTAAAIRKRFNIPVYRNIIMKKVDPKEFKKAKSYERLSLASRETEADMVFVNKKGVFCVECKHRNGILIGNSSQAEWTFSSRGDGFDTIQNPFRQNYKHICALSDLGITSLYNIVCTNADYRYDYAGNRYESKNTKYCSFLRNREREALVQVGAFGRGVKEFAKDVESLPDIFTDEEVKRIEQILRENVATKKERRFHAKLQRFRKYNK